MKLGWLPAEKLRAVLLGAGGRHGKRSSPSPGCSHSPSCSILSPIAPVPDSSQQIPGLAFGHTGRVACTSVTNDPEGMDFGLCPATTSDDRISQ